MKKKIILRAAVILLILISLVVLLNNVFRFADSQIAGRYITYFNLPKDTVDVFMTGTSGIDRYWIAAKGYEDYGITAYPISFDAMPAWLMVNVIREAVTVQNPKLIVVDMRPFTVTYNNKLSKYEPPVHRVTDIMTPFTPNWFDAVTKSVKIIGKRVGWFDFSPLSFYLSFIKYHSRWEERGFSVEEWVVNPSQYLGMFFDGTRSVAQVMLPLTEKTDELIELDSTCEESLYELLDYLDGIDCDVLFLDTPKYLSEKEYGRMNTVRSILDERGYTYKCYDAEDGNYNLHTDFYNETHVNYRGAEKFTDVFASYLKENYELPDRREDEACAADWDGVYADVLARYDALVRRAGGTLMEIQTEQENGVPVITWDFPPQYGGYAIYRTENPGGEYTEIQLIEDSQISSFVDETAVPGKTYYYMVRPFLRTEDSIEYGFFSHEKAITR